MSIDEKPPLKKQAGIIVLLAIAVVAWYGISQRWFSLENRSGPVEAPATSVSTPVESAREGEEGGASIDVAKESMSTKTE